MVDVQLLFNLIQVKGGGSAVFYVRRKLTQACLVKRKTTLDHLLLL